MANSIVKCPDCGSKSIAHNYHTELEIINCQNMKRAPDLVDENGKFAGVDFICPSIGRWANLFDRQGNFLRRVSWKQRGIEDNQPNELIMTEVSA